jgi:thymidine kinase
MAKLYFYYAAMNAGKTTTLLQADYNYRERGMSTLLFTPAIDTRHGLGKIASRIGLSADALAIEPDFNFFHYVNQREKVNCILVDEAQFLTKSQVYQLAQIVDQLNIPVLTYGLRSDFMAEPFVGSQYLLILADELVELKGVCHCGRKATMNMRIDAQGKPVREGEQVEIGGNDRYVAVCRKHYFA